MIIYSKSIYTCVTNWASFLRLQSLINAFRVIRMLTLLQLLHFLKSFEFVETDWARVFFLCRIRNLSPHFFWDSSYLRLCETFGDVVLIQSKQCFVRHIIRVRLLLNSSGAPGLLHYLLKHPLFLVLRRSLPDHDHVIHDKLHHHFSLPAPHLLVPLGFLFNLLISLLLFTTKLLLQSLNGFQRAAILGHQSDDLHLFTL